MAVPAAGAEPEATAGAAAADGAAASFPAIAGGTAPIAGSITSALDDDGAAVVRLGWPAVKLVPAAATVASVVVPEDDAEALEVDRLGAAFELDDAADAPVSAVVSGTWPADGWLEVDPTVGSGSPASATAGASATFAWSASGAVLVDGAPGAWDA